MFHSHGRGFALAALLVAAPLVVPAGAAGEIRDLVFPKAVPIIQLSSATALAPGDLVAVRLVDELGRPVVFPHADVGVFFFPYEAATSYGRPGLDLSPASNQRHAAWGAAAYGLSLDWRTGIAYFRYGGLPGDMHGAHPGVVWAFYRDSANPETVSYSAFYSFARSTHWHQQVPFATLQSASATPVFAN